MAHHLHARTGLAHYLRHVQQFRDDEQHRANGNHRLRYLGADPGKADQRIAFKNDQHDVAVPGEDQEEADDHGLGQQHQWHAEERWHHRDQARHADVRTLQGRKRGAVIGQPGELHRGDLVIPGKRCAGPAVNHAEHDDQGQADDEEYRDCLQQALEQRTGMVKFNQPRTSRTKSV